MVIDKSMDRSITPSLGKWLRTLLSIECRERDCSNSLLWLTIRHRSRNRVSGSI
jgi:hypothetical protein